ncbi:MAG: LVIVD repeat-containing protein [Thermoplasmatota archaeon]
MRSVLAAALLVSLGLAGCLADDDDAGSDSAIGGDGLPELPIYPLPEAISGLEFILNGNEEAADGIWLHEGKAYLSGPAGLRILDITDPAEPVLLAADIPDTASRDVDIMEHPNGKLYAVLAGQGVVELVDVTVPERSEVVAKTTLCSHNIAVVPNSTVVYSSWSLCHATAPGMVSAGDIEIIDFADPENPTSMFWEFPPVAITEGGVPRPVTATSCHDVTFQADRQLAYCAGVTDTLIWDVSDPLAPEIIQVIDWPGTNIHHAAWPARGGDLLVLGDEFAGVAAPSPPCSETVRDPTSALWFFDVSDMSMPTPVGYFQVEWEQLTDGDEPLGPWRYCSTHFGTMIEDRDALVMGWYAAGTVIVDFSDPANAQQVAHYHAPGTNTWESRYYNGHIYTGDTGRGMDILKII